MQTTKTKSSKMRHLFLTIFLCLTLVAAQAQTVRYVMQGGVGAGDGSSWTNASGDLQEMINAAAVGDEIWVAAGTYYPNRPANDLASIDPANRNNAFVVKEGVKIFGGFPDVGNPVMSDRSPKNYPTVFSGNIGDLGDATDNCYHVVIGVGALTDATVLDGLTVTGGYSTSNSGSIAVNGVSIIQYYGGGISLLGGASIKLDSIIVSGNNARDGGGIYSINSSPILNNVLISGNTAISDGGGFYNQTGSPIFNDVQISGNTATTYGGGVYNQSGSPIFNRVQVSGNTANSDGGGFYNTGSNLALNDVLIDGNKAVNGGGFYNRSGSPTLNNVQISRDTATTSGGGFFNFSGSLTCNNIVITKNGANNGSGGGIYFSNSSGNTFTVTITNLLMTDNTASGGGGGGYFHSGSNSNMITVTLTNATISGNKADLDGSISNFYYSTVTLRNSIVWGNTANSSPNGSRITYSYSLLQNANTETGVISAEDPLFVDADNGDYRLSACSPAMNIGLNSYIPVEITADLNANQRIVGEYIDLGAYEFQFSQSGGSGVITPTAEGRVYVKQNCFGDGNNGSSWEQAYPDLANVLFAAATNTNIKEIWVAEGIYKPRHAPENTTQRDRAFILVSGVKLYGGFEAANPELSLSDRETVMVDDIVQMKYKTVLSGDIDGNGVVDNGNAYHAVIGAGSLVAGQNTACLDGFTLTEGNASGTSSITVNSNSIDRSAGGGITLWGGAAPTLAFLNISGNRATDGGGFYNIDSSPALRNVLIADNNVKTSGGGVYNKNGSPAFDSVLIVDNKANSHGGGFFNYSGTPTMNNVTIARDTANANGGGFYNLNDSPVLTHVLIDGNRAVEGGGFYNRNGSPELNNVQISGNKSTSNGGGFFNSYGSLTWSNIIFSGNEAGGSGSGGGFHFHNVNNNTHFTVTITNVQITNNTAGGAGGGCAFISPDKNRDIIANLINATVVGNKTDGTGGGIYKPYTTGSTTLRNSIVWGNTSSNIGHANDYGGSYAYSLLQNANAQTGVISTEDPQFVDADNGDYRLSACSPAINIGLNSSMPTEITADLDDNQRIVGEYIDLGAYEFQFSQSGGSGLITPTAEGRVYVKQNCFGDSDGNDGSSWEKAYPDLANVLLAAATNTNIKEIWVAEGIYKPRHAPENTMQRDRAFILVPGVKLYGGFEAADPELSLSDRETAMVGGIVQMKHKTVLSGDIDGNGVVDDGNVYHAVIGAGSLVAGQNTARLDGFTVSGGNASGTNTVTINSNNIERSYGGGIALWGDASPELALLDIRNNVTSYYGGGLYNNEGSPALRNVLIADNKSSAHDGGGFYNKNGAPTFDSVQITRNTAKSNGGGFFNNADNPIFNHVLIDGNKATNGGGFYNNNGSPTLNNVQISGDTATTNGGGFFNRQSSLTWNNIVLSNNTATTTGGGFFFQNSNNNTNYTVSITNAQITNNTASNAGGWFQSSDNNRVITTTLTNVTIAGNKATNNCGGIYNANSYSTATLRNSIVWGNTAPSSPNEYRITYSHSLLQNALYSLTGIISAEDPMFVDADNGDYRLSACSPAINTGLETNLPSGITADLDGKSRTKGFNTDLGAYEFQDAPDITPYSNGRVYVNKSCFDLTKDGSSWANAYPCLADVLFAAQTNNAIREIWVAEGVYMPRHVSSDEFTHRDRAFVLINDVKIYGSFPATGTPDIDERNTKTCPSVLSGDIGNISNIDDNCYHIVVGVGALTDATVLDGFAVKNAYSTSSDNATITVNGVTGIKRNYGGGIALWGASPKFDSLTVANNVAYYGGGFYNDADNPALTNIVVNNNKAYYGGGFYNNNGAPTFDSVFISGNVATSNGGGFYNSANNPVFNYVFIDGNKAASNGGGFYNNNGAPSLNNVRFAKDTATSSYGGGFYNHNNVTLTWNNILFAGNVANQGGGLYFNNGALTLNNGTIADNKATTNCGGAYSKGTLNLRNTIIWGNTASNYPHIAASTLSYSRSLLQNGGSTTGIISSADPLFVGGGDYRLQSGSPAIDKGDASYNSTTADLAGSPRIQGCAIDLGAYESAASLSVQPDGAGRVYVTVAGAGTMDGSSWANAYPGLADPLLNAASVPCIKEIWVAEGTYYPQHPADGVSTKSWDKAFVMVKGVKIYGGFVGGEDELSDRDSTVNEHGIVQMKHKSILNGDINKNDTPNNFTVNKTDNVSHVVIAAGEMVEGTDTATLDGFTITGGYAYNNTNSYTTINGKSIDTYDGGGIYVMEASPVFTRDSIVENSAGLRGGGMNIYGQSSQTRITHTIFNDNRTDPAIDDADGGAGLNIHDGDNLVELTMFCNNKTVSNGGGIYIRDGASQFNRIVVVGNSAQWLGGGVYIHSGYNTFTNTRISGNTAGTSGGGLLNRGASTVINTLFSGNTAGTMGGGIANQVPATYINVTVAGNFSSGGFGLGGIANSSTETKYYNVLVWNNKPVDALNGSSNVQPTDMPNSLIQGLIGTGGKFDGTNPANDPLFVSPDLAVLNAPKIGGDYRLQFGSPAIDEGDNAKNNTAQDLADNPRIQGCNIDLGAYEVNVPAVLSNIRHNNGTVYVKTTATGAGDGSSWANAYGGLADPLAAAKAMPCIRQIWVAAGTYKPARRADDPLNATQNATDCDNAFEIVKGVKIYGGFNAANPEDDINKRNTVTVNGVIQMVNATILSGDLDSNDDATDASKANNARHVVVAADDMIRGSGTDSDTARLDGFVVSGGNAKGPSGDYSIKVNGRDLYANDGGGIVLRYASPNIANIVVSDNMASSSGGGIFNSAASPIMRHLTVIDNKMPGIGGYGGGICNKHSSPVMTHIVISGNAATNGGGLYNLQSDAVMNHITVSGNANCGIFNSSSSPVMTNGIVSGSTDNGIRNLNSFFTMTNVTVTGNSTSDSGGGIWNDNSYNTMTNVTIVGNHADDDGGGIYYRENNSSVITDSVRNTVIWGNTATNGNNISYYGSGTLAYFTHSLVEGSGGSGSWDAGFGIDGGGNIDSDPMFASPVAASSTPTTTGDYRLQSGSPAIDNGDNALVPSGIIDDLDGSPRIQGCSVDMGAYETASLLSVHPDANGRVYVTVVGAGTMDGSSWANAYPGLADPLVAAQSMSCIKQIWVAEGTYYPTRRADDPLNATQAPTDRNNAFVMVEGVKVYGGFVGTETNLSERDTIVTAHGIVQMKHKSILSGDLDNDDATNADQTNNAYHVVVVAGDMSTGPIIDTVCLDGFTVTKGYADCPADGHGSELITVNGKNIYQNSGGGIITMHVENAVFIINCVTITGNSGGFGGANGGGMFNEHSSLILTNVVISENYGDHGGGGMFNGNSMLKLTKVVIIGNTANVEGGGMSNWYSSPVLTDVLISGNKAGNAGGMLNESSSPVLTNVTISGNVATDEGGGMHNGMGFNTAPKVINSIIWGNTAGDKGDNVFCRMMGSREASFSHSLVGGSGGSGSWNIWEFGIDEGGNIDVDPMFVSYVPATSSPTTGGDYRLQSGSPAIDKGNDTVYDTGKTPDLSGITDDLAGSPRIQGCSVDMGAYEAPGLISGIYPDGAGIVYVTVTGAGDGDGSSWANAYPGLADPLVFAKEMSCIKQIWVAAGTYYPQYPANGLSTDNRDKAFVMVAGVKIYGGFLGTETNLSERDTIIGVHGTVQMVNKTILSGDLSDDDIENNTSTKDDNAYHVVVVAGDMITGVGIDSDTARLDGLTVTKGYADGSTIITVNGKPVDAYNGGGIAFAESDYAVINCVALTGNGGGHGGGIFTDNASPILTNVVISENKAFNHGGGMANRNDAAPQLTKVIISGNTANMDGGGMLNDNAAAPVLTDVVISGNTATTYGGGMINDNNAVPVLTNVTLSCNAANSGGGGMFNDRGSEPIVVNSVIWGNKSINSALDNVYNLNGGSMFSYSLIEGSGGSGSWDTGFGSDGGGNIDVDPKFVNPVAATLAPTTDGDYGLLADSPAIEKGDNASYLTILNIPDFTGETDLAGNPRLYGANIDMGAFESQDIQPTISAEDDYNSFVITTSGGTVVTDVLANDDIPVGCSPIIEIVLDSPMISTVTISGDNKIVFTLTNPTYAGIFKITYRVICDGATAEADLYIVGYRPLAVKYVACPGASTAPTTPQVSQMGMGFLHIPGVEYWWYDAETGGNLIKATASDTIVRIKDGTERQTWWAEPHYNNVIFPRDRVDLELGDCGVTNPEDCAKDGTILFKEDFGGNNETDPMYKTTGIPDKMSSNYTHVFTPSPYNANLAPYLEEQQYMIAKKGEPHKKDNANGFWDTIYDHTYPDTDKRGYFVEVNAAEESGQFYEYRIDGLCAGFTLYFSAWINNVVKDNLEHHVNQIFTLEDLSGYTIAQYYTGDILNSNSGWKQYGFEFPIPDNVTSVRLKIFNNGKGSIGNDFALDDIEIRLCVPPVTLNIPDTVTCKDGQLDIAGEYTDDQCTFGDQIAYQWEFHPVGGGAWTSLRDAVESVSCPTTYTLQNTLTVLPLDATKEGYYRMRISSPSSISSVNCSASSDSVLVLVAETAKVSDLRIDVCPSPARPINLTSYLDSAAYNTVSWERLSITGPTVDAQTGEINTGTLIGMFKYRYSMTSKCGTKTAIAYVNPLKKRLLRRTDTISVCKDELRSRNIQINKILGIDLSDNGEWQYDNTVNPDNTVVTNVTTYPEFSSYHGAIIFDAYQAWMDASSAYTKPYRGDANAKMFIFRYSATGSCVGDVNKDIVIVVTEF
jgi:hypothetical protein